MVHAGKLGVQEEYAQKAKDLEIQQRVARSNSIASSRVKKMKARDEMLEHLKRQVLLKLAAVTKTPAYEKIMTDLLIQGLEKIQENEVELQCRQEDATLVQKIIPVALKAFKVDAPKVTLSSTKQIPSKSCAGGLVLTACNGKIVVDNTLDERLSIAYTAIMPQVRKMLFPNN